MEEEIEEQEEDKAEVLELDGKPLAVGRPVEDSFFELLVGGKEVTDVTLKLVDAYLKVANHYYNKKESEYKEVIIFGPLRENIIELQKERKEVVKKINKVLGSLYEGPIAQKRISFRRGKIYRYRERYPIRLSNAIQYLIKCPEEVAEKFSSESMKVIIHILNNYKDVIETEDKGGLEFVIKAKFPKFEICQPDFNLDEDRMEQTSREILDERGNIGFDRYYVEGFKLEDGRLCFVDEKDEEIRMSQAIKRLVEDYYKPHIETAKEMMLAKVKETKDKLDVIAEEIKTKFSKQLVYAQLMEQTDEEKWKN